MTEAPAMPRIDIIAYTDKLLQPMEKPASLLVLEAGAPEEPEGFPGGVLDLPADDVPEEREEREEREELDLWAYALPTEEPEAVNGGALGAFWGAPITWDAVLADPIPPAWLVECFVPARTLGMIYGPPGSLKSFLAMDLAVDVVLNRPTLPPLNSETPVCAYAVKQTRVLWLDFDMGRERCCERVSALFRARGAMPGENPGFHIYSFPPNNFNAGNPEHIDKLCELIGATGAGLVVIDNLLRVSGGRDENSGQMDMPMSGLRRCVDMTGAAIVVIHHANKSGKGYDDRRPGERVRGHSSIEAALDYALCVDRTDGTDDIRARPTKERGNRLQTLAARWTWELDMNGALLRGRFKQLAVKRAVPAYQKVAGEIPALLMGLDNPPSQNALCKALEERFGLKRAAALEALNFAEKAGEIVSWVEDPSKATSPKRYKAKGQTFGAADDEGQDAE